MSKDIDLQKDVTATAPTAGACDRFTMQLNAVFEHCGDEPKAVQVAIGLESVSQLEPYQRRVKIGEDWAPLDFGWVPWKDVRVAFIQNISKLNPTINPTEAEILAAKSAIILWGIRPQTLEHVVAVDSIIPKDVGIIRPQNDLYFVRCASGTTEYKITVFPK